jgi:hypothetical protein
VLATLAGSWHGAPLVEAHHRGALVLEDGFVRVDAHEQLVAQLAGLQHGAGMAWEEVCERAQGCFILE